MAAQFFITVKYGENKQEIFNPHCKTQLLLDCIREKCKRSDSEILDLVDESGQIANISDIENSSEYASQFVEGRRDYVLIRVSKSESTKEPNKYEPLLDNLDKTHPDLQEMLRRMSKPNQQISHSDKKYRSARKRGNASQSEKSKSSKRNSTMKM